MENSKVVFFGSSPFSCVVLGKLLGVQGLTLYAVVTTPDQPAGRHLKLTPNPVKIMAQEHGILVFDNITLWGSEGALLGLVAAYGKIIPQNILDKFNGQIFNIHPSLLPKYRGPSPLQQQILDGVTETGVTIIQLDAKIDHGPIIAQEKDTICSDDTWITLGNRLFKKGAEMFTNFVNNSPLRFPSLNLREGLGASYIPQDDFQATFTKKLTRQDGFLPWEQFNKLINTSTQNHHDLHSHLSRLFRAHHPWPGVWTLDPHGKRVKLVSLNPLMVLGQGEQAPREGSRLQNL